MGVKALTGVAIVILAVGCHSQQAMQLSADSARSRLAAAPDYNLGFERFEDNGSPARWICITGDEQHGRYHIDMDPAEHHGGSRSLHINAGNNAGYCIVKQTSGIVEALRGKRVKFDGWVRMLGDVRTAGIALRAVASRDSLLVAPVETASNAEGVADWQFLSLTTTIDTSAIDLEFGVYMQGTGEAWFDDLAIDTNGVAFAR